MRHITVYPKNIKESILAKALLPNAPSTVELVHNNIYDTRQEAQLSIFEYIKVYYDKVRRNPSIDLQAPLVFESKQPMASTGCVC